MPNNHLVLIVGAGPTGLVLALWLAKRRFPGDLSASGSRPPASGRAYSLGSGRRTTRSDFRSIEQRAIRNRKLTIARVNWFSTYRVHHRVATRFREKCVFLLGDAAHVHSPVGGQGMNTGIGDAVNLAWKLAAVLTGNAHEKLLATYEPERIGFARRLVATTDRVFTW